MSQSTYLPLQQPKIKEFPNTYKANLIFDKNQDLSKYVFETSLNKICSNNPKEKSLFLIKLKEFYQLKCDMMTEIEFNCNAVRDRNDPNYERAQNCKDKVLRGPKYGAQQDRDYVMDTYFKHLAELESRFEVNGNIKHTKNEEETENESEEKVIEV